MHVSSWSFSIHPSWPLILEGLPDSYLHISVTEQKLFIQKNSRQNLPLKNTNNTNTKILLIFWASCLSDYLATLLASWPSRSMVSREETNTLLVWINSVPLCTSSCSRRQSVTKRSGKGQLNNPEIDPHRGVDIYKRTVTTQVCSIDTGIKPICCFYYWPNLVQNWDLPQFSVSFKLSRFLSLVNNKYSPLDPHKLFSSS